MELMFFILLGTAVGFVLGRLTIRAQRKTDYLRGIADCHKELWPHLMSAWTDNAIMAERLGQYSPTKEPNELRH